MFSLQSTKAMIAEKGSGSQELFLSQETMVMHAE